MMLPGSRLVLTAAIYEVTMQRIKVLVVELEQKLREIDSTAPSAVIFCLVLGN
jgi:hypothetical protein